MSIHDPMRRKGQVWSLDFASSAVVFLSVLAALLFAWAYASNETGAGLEMKRMEMKVMDISEALVATAGVPSDWSPSDVRSIGLSSSEGMLNATKVAYFSSMDYDEARLKVGAGTYGFYFRVRDGANATLAMGGSMAEAGRLPSNASLIVPVVRYVSADGTPAAMEFMLWKA